MQIILHVVAQTNTSIHILLLFFSVKNKQEGSAIYVRGVIT